MFCRRLACIIGQNQSPAAPKAARNMVPTDVCVRRPAQQSGGLNWLAASLTRTLKCRIFVCAESRLGGRRIGAGMLSNVHRLWRSSAHSCDSAKPSPSPQDEARSAVSFKALHRAGRRELPCAGRASHGTTDHAASATGALAQRYPKRRLDLCLQV